MTFNQAVNIKKFIIADSHNSIFDGKIYGKIQSKQFSRISN